MFKLAHENSRGTFHTHKDSVFLRSDMSFFNGFRAVAICQDYAPEDKDDHLHKQARLAMMFENYNITNGNSVELAHVNIEPSGKVHVNLAAMVKAILAHNDSIDRANGTEPKPRDVAAIQAALDALLTATNSAR